MTDTSPDNSTSAARRVYLSYSTHDSVNFNMGYPYNDDTSDYYVFTIDATSNFSLSLNYENLSIGAYGLNARLYNSNGGILVSNSLDGVNQNITSKSISYNGLAVGTYYVSVSMATPSTYTYPNGVYSSYDLNISATPLVTAKPDLVINNSGFYLGSSSVNTNGSLDVYYSVSNNGTAAAPASTLGIYLDGNWIWNAPVDAIDANSTSTVKTVSFIPSYWAWGLGTHSLYIKANNNLAVDESNTSNNISNNTLSFNVVKPVVTPDLVISISPSPSPSVDQGNPVSFSYTISNTGTGTAPASVIGIYLDGTKQQTGISVGSIGAGGVLTGTYSLSTAGLAAKQYSVLLKADDFNNMVTESDDYNNESGFQYFTVVAAADITPPQLLTSTPNDNLTNVATNTDIVLTFNETVQPGTGSIELYNYNDLSIPVRTIPITSSEVMFSGSQMTINLKDDLSAGSHIEVRLNSGVVKDLAGNAFSGLQSGQLDFSITPIVPIDDFSSDTTTLGNLKVGGVAMGNIETHGDADWFKVSLTAGHSYIFHANKTSGTAALSDSVLTLYRDNGKGGANIVWSDDNSGGNNNALINFTATGQSAGVYYLGVKDSLGGTGTYTVTAELDTSVTERPYFIQALDSGRHWGNIGQTNSFTYSFAAQDSYIKDSQSWIQGQHDAVVTALKKYSDITGLKFTERSSGELPVGSDSDNHMVFNIREINENNGEVVNNLAAFANWPLFSGSGDGDVYIDDELAGTYNAGVFTPKVVTDSDKSFLFETYLHEIGHALGLKHSFDGSYVLLKGQDDHDHTIMSYSHLNLPTEDFTLTHNHATDLQWIDKATIHYLYGVNKAASAHNPTALSNQPIDDTYHFSDRYIWDGDGEDTLDASDQTGKVFIDLNPGSWIYAGIKNASIFEAGQAFIGYKTIIEKAIGGSSDDTIIGNEQPNTLIGGTGNDKLDGGLNIDTVIYNGNSANFNFIPTATGVEITDRFGNNGTDTLISIEKVQFNDKTIDLTTGNLPTLTAVTGDSGSNSLPTSASNELVDGGAGADIAFFSGTLSNASIAYSAALNAFSVTTAIGGVDTVLNVETFKFDDQTVPAYTTIPVSSFDVDFYLAKYPELRATLGTNKEAAIQYFVETGYAEGKTVSDVNNDNLIGSSFDDLLNAGVGDDTLEGGAGNDTLTGGTGNDILRGGSGIDALQGEDGNDTYQFNLGDGNDQIIETTGTDRIVLGANITPALVSFNRVGNEIKLAVSNDDSISFAENADGSYAIEQIEFQDGSVWSTNAIEQSIKNSLSWTAQVISLNNYQEAPEDIHAVINNGILHIDPSLANISRYWTQQNLAFHTTFDGDNFKIEASIKNPSAEGGLPAYDFGISATLSSSPSQGFGATLMGDSWAASYANVYAAGSLQIAVSELVSLLNDWHTVSVETKNQTVTVSYDGIVIKEYGYTGTVGLIDNINLSFLGSGSIDWVKAYNNGQMVINDDFNGFSTEILGITPPISDNDTLFGSPGNDGISAFAGDDVVFGLEGHDTLDGGTGNDILSGGKGNDTYIVDSINDVITELTAQGTDKVKTAISWTLGDNLENLTLTGTTAANGTGNTLKNTLTGNSKANTLNGNAGADKLVGNAGNDILIGGAGKDTLTGGLGADKFKFTAITETGITATTRDTITDFKHAQGDKIDLSAIDANTAIAGNNAFATLNQGTAFSGTFTNRAELFFDQTTHILYGNNDADATADFSILLTGVTTLTTADFVL